MKNINVFQLLFSLSLVSCLFFTSCQEEEVDPCADITCLNGGACDNGACDCPEGTEGSDCSTIYRDALTMGNYNANDVCDSGNFNDNAISIAPSEDGLQYFIIDGYGGFDNPRSTIRATITGANTFVIEQQTDSGARVVVSGDKDGNNSTGSWSPSQITYTYTVTFSDGSKDTCVETMTIN